MKEKKLKGIPAASGISIGNAYLLGKEEFLVEREQIQNNQIPLQIQLFEEALINTRKEILDLQKKIAKELGADEAEIFDAHLLVLEDRMLIEEVITRLKKEKINVAYIFQQVLKRYINVFSKIEDEYLKERVSDINDVGRRVLRQLLKKKHKTFEDLKGHAVIVAHDLSPSDTASMHKRNVCAFVTDIGAKTSHTAIMAKSLEIPAVVGLERVTRIVNPDDEIIVDGNAGIVIINPTKETLKQYRKKEEEFRKFTRQFFSLRNLPAKTTDGARVRIVANIELPDEIPSVIQHGAEGIGLYRTEYFYMNRVDLPSEDEQYEAYKFVAEAISPNPVVIRTLDLGGDKFISQLQIPKDMSPFLGWRAIRFCLARPDIFKAQLRAILRASVHGKLKLMYPMISGIEELRKANNLLRECKHELHNRGVEFDNNIETGVMIEVPSAAMTADFLARETQFFSIGTNDLIQYSLAVDRTNEKVAYLYEPSHPAVLRMIKNIIHAGHQAGIWVGMCGEMSAEPSLALLLLGLELDEFSMPPFNIPEIKQIIRSVSITKARQIAHKALELSTSKAVEDYATKELKMLGFRLAI